MTAQDHGVWPTLSQWAKSTSSVSGQSKVVEATPRKLEMYGRGREGESRLESDEHEIGALISQTRGT
jgi:hypothetical protein